MEKNLFVPRGPFEIPVERFPAGRTLVDDLSEFWESVGELRRSRGCYVFAMRTGRAVVPIYVGKTINSFERECFTYHKLAAHYHRALLQYRKGTPVMFFLVPPRRKGKPNGRHIGELEEFLINVALARNPALSNVVGTVEEKWGITGVLRTPRGRISNSAKKFKTMMNL